MLLCIQYKSQNQNKIKMDFWSRICHYVILLLLACSDSTWEFTFSREYSRLNEMILTNHTWGLQKDGSRFMPSKTPKGWLNCPNESTQIIADTFVVFKTPLDKVYNCHVPFTKRFHVSTLFSSLHRRKVNLGLWIDLTNTDRYFNKFQVEEKGCTYVKIPCAGHKTPPTEREVQWFINVCWRFCNENSYQYIAVHCTHGFNRTGFMIASYLIVVFKYDVAEVISMFAEARPPGIYRQYLIDELFKRYSKEKPIQCPGLPDWV